MSSILIPKRGPGHTIRGSTVASDEFDAFLSEVLPPIGLSPSAYRRRNIKRRIVRRMETAGIHEFHRYLDLVRHDPEELEVLRSILVVTISRFFRNAQVFHFLSREVLPRLAEKSQPVAWSAGCASGEEPYSVRMAWEEMPGEKPGLALLATDVDPVSLERAEAGSYQESSLRELPAGLRRKYFSREGNSYRICEAVRGSVQFRKLDLLRDPPPGRFDLILCRNAAFTYFSPEKRLAVVGTFAAALREGGYLVIGRTESLPRETVDLFEPVFPAGRIYRLAP
jgi:chemotaxis protein methyltransferase CheR